MGDWAVPAIGGAALAALGYVGQLFVEWYQRLLAERKARRARLVELLALIRAGDAAFAAQSEVRDQLSQSIRERVPDDGEMPFDRQFAKAHASLMADEREKFDIVRAYTMYTLHPLNESLIEWISTDVDFRVALERASPRTELAVYLQKLEAHLLLWRAKYNAWIPDHPERALVYLADEEKHGVEFPKRGAELVEAVLKLQE